MVFELSPGSAGGPWTATTIHSFNSGSDGADPKGALVVDTAGNVYGATSAGGIGCNGNLCGTVYKLTPRSGGTWKETILHPFESATDGSMPEAGVFMDSSGNLYGTVYKLTPRSGGTWKETILHPFESATDGSMPEAGVFMDSSGNLYGTTYHGGGRYGYGPVYEIPP